MENTTRKEMEELFVLIDKFFRKDSTPYEIAELCVTLKNEHDLNATDIAGLFKSKNQKLFGQQRKNWHPTSPAHINNLLRCFNNLHPTIKRAWKDQEEYTSFHTLFDLITEIDQDKQMKAWSEIKLTKTQPYSKKSNESYQTKTPELPALSEGIDDNNSPIGFYKVVVTDPIVNNKNLMGSITLEARQEVAKERKVSFTTDMFKTDVSALGLRLWAKQFEALANWLEKKI